MPYVVSSSFIAVTGPRRHSFKEFQDLPTLAREALVDCFRRNGRVMDDDETLQYIIDRYDVNQTLTAMELQDSVLKFFNRTRNRMVACYVEHGCNMIAAKLAWRDDY